jgi:HEPN superfamily AbiU2-like protein
VGAPESECDVLEYRNWCHANRGHHRGWPGVRPRISPQHRQGPETRPGQPSIFSRASLGRRKQAGASEAPSWIGDCLDRAYVPVPADFRRLRAHVKRRRRIYEANYRDLRHKIYAHRVVADDSEVQPIVAKTNVRELERLLLFLLRFYESMWHLFMNGSKPTLGRLRYSVKATGRLSLPRTSASGVHRRMVREAEQVLARAAAQQGTQPTARRRKTRRG